MSAMGGLRLVLVALLIVATALFAAGVIAERSGESTEPAGVRAAEAQGGEREEGETQGLDEDRPEPAAHADERERVLGVDVESTPLIVLAVAAGLGLAALAATPLGRLPAVLLTIAVIAIAWAALDVREAVHQLDESRSGIATIAIIVSVLHLAVAAIAGRLAARARRAGLGSPGRPGTMPA